MADMVALAAACVEDNPSIRPSMLLLKRRRSAGRGGGRARGCRPRACGGLGGGEASREEVSPRERKRKMDRRGSDRTRGRGRARREEEDAGRASPPKLAGSK
jgi:hypothetical protein